MHRFFVEEPARVGEVCPLPPDEARHAAQVLRLSPGDPVEILDGQRLYAAELTHVDKQRVYARVGAELPGREPRICVTLFQGLPKGDKMEGILQKCTELGVHAVQPLEMARCVARWTGKRAAEVQARWQRIAREAAKQCGRARVPTVLCPSPLEALQPLWSQQQRILVPWEEARGTSLRSVLADVDAGAVAIQRIGLVIGPEGGITGDEMTRLQAFGARPVTLGPRILRTETAGMAALAAIMTLYGELE